MNYLKSPITGTGNVWLKKKIDSEHIIRGYYTAFNIDVSDYFKEIKFVEIYECEDTGYEFYYPFTLSGKGELYDELDKNSWYYLPTKWEHKMTMKYVEENISILEVGCGAGSFLDELSKSFNNLKLVGLELNLAAISRNRNPRVKLIPELIDMHALKRPNYYDLICSFQVLEHIGDVHGFLNDSIKCLKNGGKLVIGVPNNFSFVRLNSEFDYLNMPPHHMGLWTSWSLKKLVDHFPLKLLSLKYEPLQHYHYDWYLSIYESRLKKSHLMLFVIYKKFGVRLLFKFMVRLLSPFITGHTMLAVFVKV